MMIYPQYVVLTVTRVAMRNPKNPKHATANILNPPVRQLFVLPLMLSKSQYSDHAEIENADGRLLTFAEHFEDVVNAINDASLATMAVARPVRRDEIAAVAHQAEHLRNLGAEMRAAEGAKHQDETIEEHVERTRRWDDFVQTDGENVGLPIAPRAGARDLLVGDLRIIKMDGDRYWIEIATETEAGYTWARHGVPAELLPLCDTREAAQAAVKLAGYSRRLWEE